MTAILAQVQRQPAGGGDEALMMMLMIYGGIFFFVFVIKFFFLLMLSNCLKQISRRNRQMEPGKVWFGLIPIFGIVWELIIILKLADSLRDEFDDLNMRGDGDYGKTLGIVYFASSFVCGCVAIVCFIMYWMKIAGYSKQLASGGSFDDDFGDYDDQPRKKKKKRRDEDYDDDEYEDDDDRDRGNRR